MVDDLMAEWDLRADGPPVPGTRALLRPVRTRAGRAAVLKVAEEPRPHEHLALVRWDGGGAARVLRADPRRGALLLEELPGGDLAEAWDVEACETVASLYATLHRPAGEPFRRLSTWTAAAAEELAGARGAPLPRRLVEQAASLARSFATDDGTDGLLLHGDLHYEHVRAGERGWAVISPDPLSGDPPYEVAPLLWHRFDELAGDVRNGVRRRFHAAIDAADLDEDRARDWVVLRAVTRALRSTGDDLTRCIAVAKAVQE